MFLYYANEEVTTSLIVPLKHLNTESKNISKNIEAVFFKLGTRNVHHKKKDIGTLYVVAMVTLFAPASFCGKQNIPNFNVGLRVLLRTHNSPH